MLENNSNNKHSKNILSKKNKYSTENLVPFLDCNTNNETDIRMMILKLDRIVKALEDEVINLKQKARNEIN